MKTPMLESLLNWLGGLEAWNFIKKRLQQRCFPVKFAVSKNTFFYRTPRVAASGNGKTFHRLSIFYYHDLVKCSVFNELS